jgi:hypothetical protein
LLHVVGPRWIWAGGAASFALGAIAAFGLTREGGARPTVEPGVA